MNHIIGLDIGGANLKVAHSDGMCRSKPFPIWEDPDRLADELGGLIEDWLPCSGLAVTMTAELADCFTTKAEGVDRILASVEHLAGNAPVAVWQTVGEFVDTGTAREFWSLTAAANWHALATFIGRMNPEGTALLIDIGSTTTDIIPVVNGVPNPSGRTDAERMMTGELVYSGVRRTPLCAIAHSVPLDTPFEGYSQLAAELFATTQDVYVLLGDVPENPDDCATANGQAVTIESAHDRLARQLCRDRHELLLDDARSTAKFLRDVHRQRISGAIDRVLSRLDSPCVAIIVSGEGTFLANRILDEHSRLCGLPRHTLDEIFSPETSSAACAFALTRLAGERPATFTDLQLSEWLTPRST